MFIVCMYICLLTYCGALHTKRQRARNIGLLLFASRWVSMNLSVIYNGHNQQEIISLIFHIMHYCVSQVYNEPLKKKNPQVHNL